MAFKDKQKADAYYRKWREQNKQKVLGYKLAWYYRNHERAKESAKLSRQRKLAADPSLRKLWTVQTKQHFQRARIECFAAYGNQCACCGESRHEFLSIDHIGGGGTKARQSGFPAGVRLYARLRKLGWPIEYRLLCHNCNQAYGFHGFCPHSRERFMTVPTLSDMDLATVIGL